MTENNTAILNPELIAQRDEGLLRAGPGRVRARHNRTRHSRNRGIEIWVFHTNAFETLVQRFGIRFPTSQYIGPGQAHQCIVRSDSQNAIHQPCLVGITEKRAVAVDQLPEDICVPGIKRDGSFHLAHCLLGLALPAKDEAGQRVKPRIIRQARASLLQLRARPL